jgi:hypothetical protein
MKNCSLPTAAVVSRLYLSARHSTYARDSKNQFPLITERKGADVLMNKAPRSMSTSMYPNKSGNCAQK